MRISIVGDNKQQMIHAAIGIVALMAGGLIYVLYRSESLLMFEWFRQLGIANAISNVRERMGEQNLYEWIKYNMPAGLWLFSYLFIIESLWRHEKTMVYRLFLFCLPVIAILSELLQYLGVIPGTFDFQDLFSYIIAILLFTLLK